MINVVLFQKRAALRKRLQQPFEQDRQNATKLRTGGLDWLMIQTVVIAIDDELLEN